MSPAVPSFGDTNNPVLDLTQAFRETLLAQESRNQQILLPLLVITFLLLGLIIFWARAQKRAMQSKKVTWGINDHRSADSPGEKRRAWMRLPVNQYFLYARDETERYKKSRTINISGGGLLFATDQEFNKKDKMIINIEISPGKKINLIGEAAWISENPAGNSGGRFLVGIRFINIRRGDQDYIVRRILKNQQEIITQEKRKKQSECISCGMPLPAGDREENRSQCPRCRAGGGNA
jgi:Tfp pilus assembly protein PilZ